MSGGMQDSKFRDDLAGCDNNNNTLHFCSATSITGLSSKYFTQK